MWPIDIHTYHSPELHAEIELGAFFMLSILIYGDKDVNDFYAKFFAGQGGHGPSGPIG